MENHIYYCILQVKCFYVVFFFKTAVDKLCGPKENWSVQNHSQHSRIHLPHLLHALASNLPRSRDELQLRLLDVIIIWDAMIMWPLAGKKNQFGGEEKPCDHSLRFLFQTIASLLAILHVKYNRTAEWLLLYIATTLSVTFSISKGPTRLFYHCCFKGIFVFICNLRKFIVWGCAVNLKVLWGNSKVQLSFPAVGSAG